MKLAVKDCFNMTLIDTTKDQIKSSQILFAQNTSHSNAASGKNSGSAGPTKLKKYPLVQVTALAARKLACKKTTFGRLFRKVVSSESTLNYSLLCECKNVSNFR